MGKKKRVDGIIPIDIASSDPAYNGYPISEHRSCWIHVVGCSKSGEKKISIQEPQKLMDFKLTAPCFLDAIPCRARLKRRVKSKYWISKVKNKLDCGSLECCLESLWNTSKNSISKLNNKLDSGSFECYLETMWSHFPEDKRTLFTCLDCQWLQIFSKQYVLVPIVCWDHWSLLIFCHFGESLQSKTTRPCMLLLDSLQMSEPKHLEPDIRKFIFDIYKAEGRPENKQMIYRVPFLVPKVPQQRNGKECGNFVLYFIHLFVKSAPENFSIEGYPYFMKKDWFNAEAMEHFCEWLDSVSNSDYKHDDEVPLCIVPSREKRLVRC